MSKKDDQRLLPGDEVFHKCGDEPIRGIVVTVGWACIDWGPEYGIEWHDPATLSDTPIKRWKE